MNNSELQSRKVLIVEDILSETGQAMHNAVARGAAPRPAAIGGGKKRAPRVAGGPEGGWRRATFPRSWAQYHRRGGP